MTKLTVTQNHRNRAIEDLRDAIAAVEDNGEIVVGELTALRLRLRHAIVQYGDGTVTITLL